MKKTLILLLAVVLYGCGSSRNIQTYYGVATGLGSPQTIKIEATKGQKLTATLSTPGEANLRINQIISPSGKADGPFGRSLSYDIDETGEWNIIVGGSLMQGDDYTGEFTVKVKLK